MADRQRKSLLCPNCRRLISGGEPRCPYCGIRNPGSWWKNNLWTRGFRDPEQLVKTIIYVNIGIYAISLFINPSALGLSMNPLTLLSPDNTSLLLLGATGTVPIDRFHRWWTVISANYLHGGVLHIFFNMFAFRQLAPFVVREYGAYRMFIIYTVGGILGFLVSYLAGVRFTIGASAAVCALIGAALYFGKSRGGVYGQAVYTQIGGWALAIFIFGLLVPGINNWGHGGGFVAGGLLGYLLGYRERLRENLLHKLLAGGCALVTVLILAWAVLSGFYLRVAG